MHFLKVNLLSRLQCMTPQKRMELFRSAAGDCAQKEGATETDLEEVLARKSASSYAQKCIRACLGEKFGLVSMKHKLLYFQRSKHVVTHSCLNTW